MVSAEDAEHRVVRLPVNDDNGCRKHVPTNMVVAAENEGRRGDLYSEIGS